MLDNRSSQTEIAKLYNCSQSQISRIASKREDILTDWENCDDPEQKKHRFSSRTDSRRERKSESEGTPGLTDQSTSPRPPADTSFDSAEQSQANNGWLEYWKNHSSSFGRRSYGDFDSELSPWGRNSGSAGKRGLRGRPKPSANKESRISNQMLDILKNYDLCDVYCADELALLYDVMPTLDNPEEEGEDGEGEKRDGDGDQKQITVFLTCNVTGSDKRDFLIIEDSKKAEDAAVTLTSCHRAKAPHAWMTSDIYKEYLLALDYDMRSQRRYILLLVDNAPPHDPEAGKSLEHVRVLYIRSYTTPFFHGIFYTMRAHYRKQILLKLFANNPDVANLSEACEKAKKDKNPQALSVEIDLEEAVSMLGLAWKSVSPQDVVQCFSKAGICAPHIHGLPEIGGDDLPDLPEGFITDEQYEDFVNMDVDAECSGDADLVSVECRILSDLREQGFTDVGVEPSDDTMNDGAGLNTSGNSGGSGGPPVIMAGVKPESRIVSEDSGEVERSLSTLRSFLEQRGLHLHNLHALEAQIYSCHSGGQ